QSGWPGRSGRTTCATCWPICPRAGGSEAAARGCPPPGAGPRRSGGDAVRNVAITVVMLGAIAGITFLFLGKAEAPNRRASGAPDRGQEAPSPVVQEMIEAEQH